jgi:chemotaxis protein CheX
VYFVKVEYINPFIKSTIHTFSTMLEDTPKPGKPEVKKDPFPVFDISGIIGISGEAIGSVVISYPKVVALRIASKFMGEDIKIVGKELADAIGEITNIIAGNAKQDLTQFKVSISLPNVIIGTGHQIRTPGESLILMVPFISAFGNFVLEVCIKENR